LEDQVMQVNCDEKNEKILKESKEVQLSSEDLVYFESEKVFVEHIEMCVPSKEKSSATKEDREIENMRNSSTIEEFKTEQVFLQHVENNIIEKVNGEKEVEKIETKFKVEETSENCANSKIILVNKSPEGVSKTTCSVKPKKKSLDFLTSKLLQKALAKSHVNVEESQQTVSKSNSKDSSVMGIFQDGASAKSKPLEGSLGQSNSFAASKALEISIVASKSSSELNKPSVAECSKTSDSSIVNSTNHLRDFLATSSSSSSGSPAKSNLPNTSNCPLATSGMKETLSFAESEYVLHEHLKKNGTLISIVNSDPSVSHVNPPIDKTVEISIACTTPVAPMLPSPVLGGLGLLMNSYGSDEEEDM